MQQVEVRWAMVLSAVVNAAWFDAVYAEVVPPAAATAFSTARLLPEVSAWSKPTT